MNFKGMRESKNFINATNPEYLGDDGALTSKGYMDKYGIKPEDLQLIQGTNYNLHDLLFLKALKNHLLSTPVSQDAVSFYGNKKR